MTAEKALDDPTRFTSGAGCYRAPCDEPWSLVAVEQAFDLSTSHGRVMAGRRSLLLGDVWRSRAPPGVRQ